MRAPASRSGLRALSRAAGGLVLFSILPVAATAAGDIPAVPAQERPVVGTSWREQAEADLVAAHRLIEQAHPGMLEPDPAFHAWRTRGFRQAMALARQADTEARAWTALRFYAAGYQDGHLAVWRERPPSGGARWAGWNVQSRSGKYLVTRSAAQWRSALPRVGDELLSCDDVPVRDWLGSRVAPYVDRRALDAARSHVALHLTNQWPNEQPWRVAPPARCTVRTTAGRTQDIPLTWQDSFEGLTRWRAETPPQGVTAPSGSIRWIHASDFMTEDGERLSAFLAEIATIGAADEVRAVVLDTRGNNGGNAMVGFRVLQALLKERTPADDGASKATWRVSGIARDALVERLAMAARLEGADGPTLRLVAELLRGMNEALARGDATLPQPDDTPAQDPRPEGRAFGGQLVLLTDSHCASACLDFADLVRRVPGVMHAGLPTSGDTRYMDITVRQLPSGASLALPLKVWRGRPRGDNEPLVPRFPYAGDIGDTAAVQAWVRDKVLPHAQGIAPNDPVTAWSVRAPRGYRRREFLVKRYTPWGVNATPHLQAGWAHSAHRIRFPFEAPKSPARLAASPTRLRPRRWIQLATEVSIQGMS
ncbi:S41 family peptidase [Roseateles chitinivorans]|uniref:S41 family peptidase n=1 Tax=Roseateles chitinivorans TaxID=2917965 RepID=UPI003D666FFF